METVAISKFRGNIKEILKKVEHGSSYIITSKGHVVAKLIPPDNILKDAREKLSRLAKTAVIGDIVSPTGEEWKSAK